MTTSTYDDVPGVTQRPADKIWAGRAKYHENDGYLGPPLLNSSPFPQVYLNIWLEYLLPILFDHAINFVVTQSSTLIFSWLVDARGLAILISTVACITNTPAVDFPEAISHGHNNIRLLISCGDSRFYAFLIWIRNFAIIFWMGNFTHLWTTHCSVFTLELRIQIWQRALL